MRSLHILFLLALSLVIIVDGVKVLRNTVVVGDRESVGGASLANVSDQVTTVDFTICVKFNVKILGGTGWNHGARALTIEDWIPYEGAPDHPNKMLYFGLWYPLTFFAFGHPDRKGFILTDQQERTDIWTPNKWTQMCLSYRKRDAFLRVTVDGATMSINRTAPILSNTVIPPDFLTKLHIGRCSYDFSGGCSTPGGLYSDLNVWSRPFTEQEAIEWTSCKSEEKGDIVDWNTAEWKLVNMVEEDYNKDEICKPRKPGHVLFPEPRNMTAAIDLCRKMKSIVSEIRSASQQKEMIHIYSTTSPDLYTSTAGLWSGYWDEYSEGRYLSVNDASPLGSYQPWDKGEPNGEKWENCAMVYPGNEKWNDIKCDIKDRFPTFCTFEEAPYLSLRGLCFSSLFDVDYSWTTNYINGRHSFSGFLNTLLSWNADIQMWQLSLLDNPMIYATLDIDATEYPLGTFKWTFYNEPCYTTNVTEVELSFNTCNEYEFNCYDGTCIDINSRCDGKTDCPDKTDEISCNMVTIDESYIKDMPAPSTLSGSLTKINVTVDILSILEINEVDSYLALQFELRMAWFDPRIVLNNLKENINLNTVNSNDKSLIWIPEVIFFNTIDKEESKDDSKSYVTVEQRGLYAESRIQSLDNIHTYKGSENPLKISRVYSTQFLCEFDMGSYPFDSQKCRIILIMKGNTGFFTRLVVDELAYLGSIDLTQYYVSDWKIWESMNGTIGASIQVEISLGRRLLNELLTTYLPTILICVVSFCTNFFKPFFFEAIVTVNLTSLLVLTTLFISVSGNLPKTAYVKMIDIWLIFVLCVPFVETILHTLIDYLRDEDEFVVNHHGGSITTNNNNKSKENQVTPVMPVSHSGKSRNDNDLIARHELLELSARKQLYERLKINNDVIRNVCNIALKVGVPTVFIGFTICYFIVGLALRVQ